jgi:hypothetical protein
MGTMVIKGKTMRSIKLDPKLVWLPSAEELEILSQTLDL